VPSFGNAFVPRPYFQQPVPRPTYSSPYRCNAPAGGGSCAINERN
jgi:hypothetical protein